MPGWVLRQFWLRKKGEARCKVDSCDVHLNICDISLNEKVCHSIETKGVEERARTFTDIVQVFKFSKGTHVDLRSQSDQREGSEPRHLSGRIFLRTSTEMSGRSSSGANTETIPVVEPPHVSSDTQMEDPMPVTSDTPETRPVTDAHGNRRSRYRDSRSRATSRCATCSSSSVDSTQNLRKTWICSGTLKKRQTENRVAGRR